MWDTNDPANYPERPAVSNEPTEASVVTEDPVIQLLLNHDRVDDWGVMEEDDLKEYVDLAHAIRRQVANEITENIDHNNDHPENAGCSTDWHDGMNFAGDLAFGAGWWSQGEIDDIWERAKARYEELKGLID